MASTICCVAILFCGLSISSWMRAAMSSRPMALDRTFIAMTPDGLKSVIAGARRRVIYAAASLSPSVAAALINASERLGKDAVAIVIDVGAGVLRLGYGVVDAIALLREKKVPIRHQEGL